MTPPRRATRRKREAPSADLFSEPLTASADMAANTGVAASTGAEPLAEGATILRNFAEPSARALVDAIAEITAASPFRNMVTPGGYTMSVAMTNCGRLGWVTDRRGYRYDTLDPMSGEPWPALPRIYRELAMRAADAAGYAGFEPDACL